MPIVADAAVAVRGDLGPFNKDLKAGLGKAEQQAQSFGQKLKGALTPGNLLGAAGIGFGIAQITSFLGDATQAAAKFEDTVSASGVIFGEELVPGLEEWAETAHSAFGASKADALDAANGIAVFGKSAGLVGDDLTKFATDLTQLGGDLASMFGGSTEEAIGAVGSALRGEFEPIRRYGVLLDDATLRQQALEMGIISTTKNALTPQQRVLAAQAAIFDQTSDAQGDFARTSDGMMNTQRSLAAELENVSIEIGEKMLPVMLDLANFASDVGIPAIRGLVDAFDAVGEVVEGMARFKDIVNFKAGDVQRAADAMGISYMEARDLIEVANREAGQSAAEFATEAEVSAARVAVAAERTSDVAEEEFMRFGATAGASVRAMADEIQKGGPVVAAEAGKVAGMFPSEIRAQIENIRRAGMDGVVAFAAGILEKQNDPMLAMEALTKANEEALTRGAEVARLKGQLTSKELADGLNDNRPEVRLAAQAARAVIIDRLSTLNAYQWGYAVSGTFAAGMEAGLVRVRQAAVAVGSATGGAIRIESEPPDHSSPLYGITKWGGNIVKTIADGMYAELGTGRAAANALAMSLTPGIGLPGLATGAAVAPTSGGDLTVNINAPTMPMTERDIGRELRRTVAFGLNRG